jgi:hypothetical protein
LAPAAVTRLLAARRAWVRWRGEVLLVDRRRDHIDCRLNIHYPLDAIFRLYLAKDRRWASNWSRAYSKVFRLGYAVGIKAGGWRALNPFR